MTKNRDYTGLVRTPSSMAWLIRERARLQGRIERLEKLVQEIPLELEELSRRLQSLDAVFPLHEVKVEPSEIKGKKKYAPRVVAYGAITRGIYECLRQNVGGRPVYTTEIALFIARQNNLDIGRVGKEKFVRNVQKRLKTLTQQGEVARAHQVFTGNSEEGRWYLPPDGDPEDD